MKRMKVVSLALCLFLVCSLFSGCGQKPANVESNGSPVTLNGDDIYPVQCEDELSYWMALVPTLAQTYENFGDTPLGKHLEEATGIKVKYIHPQGTDGEEQFQLLVASNSLPDLVQKDWTKYAGGADLAIEDNVIYALNDYMESYAPAFTKYLNEHPDINKKALTDGGNYYVVPFIRGADWLCTYQGPIIRSDWLEKTGLDVPKSVDEFTNLMQEFKKISGSAPLFITPTQKWFVMYAYGISDKFFIDDNGKAQYGPNCPEYKEVLTTLKGWYDDGILDPDFAVADSKYQTSAILNGQIGAFYGAVVGGIGEKMNAKPAEDPDFSLMGITQITKDGRDIPEFSAMDNNVNLPVSTAISKNCKNIELALRYLDYGFTDKGYMLYNFGIEGVSYNMVDGEPVLSELLTKNPDGLTLTQVAPQYLRASYNGPFVQDERYVKQSFTFPEIQQQAYNNWSKTNMKKHLWPPIVPTGDDAQRYADLFTSITAYVDEMYVKFVTGVEPLENFDKYLEQLKSYGIDEVLAIQQSALDRYNKR